MTHATYADAPRLLAFETVRPAYQSSQREILEWLVRTHTEAERSRSPDRARFDAGGFHERLQKLVDRCGCSPANIAVRGYEVSDCAHTTWSEMRIYDVTRAPEGAGSAVRTELYARIAEAVLDRLYPEGATPPRDLLHVTCTGYASPSAAQKLVAKRGWGVTTRVTHAYHMGCYAALPAVRIAAALVASAPKAIPPQRADVVHTEVCSLHLRPSDHSAEQLVVQSLFADGHVRYSVVGRDLAERAPPQTCFAVLTTREEILPDSTGAIGWIASDHGMHMQLGADVPARIARCARRFVASLFADAGLHLDGDLDRIVFAVHPGGPRVIDALQQALGLSDRQVEASRRVLSRHGNMSSATLPHIWASLLGANEVPVSSLVASLAFGPGLTICGALMVKL